MIRIRGRVEVGFMAGNTIGRRIGEISSDVAFGTIVDRMPLGQREKVVFYVVGCPADLGNIVTLFAIGGKTGVFVVGVGGGGVILEVAIDTVVSNSFETQGTLRFMAIGTGGGGMGAGQRETVVLMQFGNPVHQPVFGIVAAGAIFPYRTVVHIGMAGDTFRFCIRKDQ